MARRRYRSSTNMTENINFQPSTCLAHIILVGTSAWALKYTTKETPMALGTFSLLFGYSMIGTNYFGHPKEHNFVTKLYQVTSTLAEIAPVPLLSTELYLLKKVSGEYAYLPAISIFIPLITKLISTEYDQIDDLVLATNLIALGYNNLSYDSPWIWGLIALTTLNNFIFGKLNDRFNVPKSDIIALGLSFFTVFAINCIFDVK